jgi:hypothetical protein
MITGSGRSSWAIPGEVCPAIKEVRSSELMRSIRFIIFRQKRQEYQVEKKRCGEFILILGE